MERLTRPNVNVDATAARFMGEEVKLQDINDRLLDLVLNGPTLNAVSKDKLRHIIRQLYDALKKYEDTGVELPVLKVVCGITGTPCTNCDYTKGALDRAVMKACGDAVLPFEKRYATENLYFRSKDIK